MKIIKQLYMKTHGFKRETHPWIPGLSAWKRVSNWESYDPKDMILESVLFNLPWKEIIKRYRKQ